MNYKCVICQINALQKRFDKFAIAEKHRNKILSKLLKDITETDFENKYSPETTRHIITRLKEFSLVADPYQKEKDESNRQLLNR